MSKITNKLNTLSEIVNLFALTRITTAIEKRLCRNKQYRELEKRSLEFEEEVLSFLTDEQKEVFRKYNDTNVGLICIREEFIYRRGMIDAFRIRDIITSSY